MTRGRSPRERPRAVLPHARAAGESGTELYGAAADRLGWGWGPIPFAINSVPRFGRAACVACPQCVGHACPVDAKNGTHNTLIRRALAAGTCHLAAGARWCRSITRRAEATGVRVVFDGADRTGGTRPSAATRSWWQPARWKRPGCCSSPGSATIRSAPTCTPTADASSSASVLSRSTATSGPGHNIATLDFVHRDRESWGGGVIFEALPLMPVVIAQMAPLFGVTVGGADHKRWMREGLPHVFSAMGIGQEIPSIRSRVGIDPQVVDRSRDAGGAAAERAPPGEPGGDGVHGRTMPQWLTRSDVRRLRR